MIHQELLRAIKAQGGRATLGDLIARTALPVVDIQQAILPALALVGGHVAVDDNGELIYSVARTRTIPAESTRLQRFLRAAYTVFQAIFYAALSVVLVAYFAFYVVVLIALAVAAIAAAARGGDCDCDCDCKGCGGGCGDGGGCGGCADCCGQASVNGCGDACFSCFTCGSPRKKGARAALRERQREARVEVRIARAERRAARSARRQQSIAALGLGRGAPGRTLGLSLRPAPPLAAPPFSRAVHAYIFGPARPPEDPRRRERNVLAFIQAHDGRATASDAVALTGLPLDQADALLLSLAARYEGDVRATDAGVIVYTFDRLLVSASEDAAVLAWVATRGGAVTVEDLARHLGLPAAAARARLGHLAALTGGVIEHGATTRVVFPAQAHAGLADLAAKSDAVRDFSYAWERLELAPHVHGVPPGKRGWIHAFNGLNLALSAVLSMMYDDPETSLSALLFEAEPGPAEAWVVGYVPFLFSLAVFAIPLVRGVFITLANRARLARNLRRVALLAVFHALEEDDHAVSSDELAGVLGFTGLRARSRAVVDCLDGLLARAARDLEGELDLSGPASEGGRHVYTFTRVYNELHAIEHERLAVDRAALALADIVYDTSTPFDDTASAG